MLVVAYVVHFQDMVDENKIRVACSYYNAENSVQNHQQGIQEPNEDRIRNILHVITSCG